MIPVKCHMIEFHKPAAGEIDFDTELDRIDLDFGYITFYFKCGHSVQLAVDWDGMGNSKRSVGFNGKGVAHGKSGLLEAKT